MNSSELICTNFLIDYFFKEFVYKNLYYYDGKQKRELCDGFIDFLDVYVVFQIKEKNRSTSPDWLRKKVYKKAVSQIKDTIQMLRAGSGIEVMNYTGEKINLSSRKRILPVILFASEETKYEPVHVSSVNKNLRINVLSIQDFQRVLESLGIPYDIVTYLEMRSAYFDKQFPELLIDEVDDELTTISSIKDEEGFIRHFLIERDGKTAISPEAVAGYRFIIQNCRNRLIQQEKYNFREYKEILKMLLRLDRVAVQQFMERWNACVEHCIKNETTWQHYLIDSRQNFGFLFMTQFTSAYNMDFVDYVLRLFKHRFMLQTVVAVVFDMINETDYLVEWKLVSYDEGADEQLDQIIKREKFWDNSKTS